MKPIHPKNWLFYAALVLAALLLLPYFSFLIKTVESRPADTTIKTQEDVKTIPPSLDELLEKQRPE